MIVINGDYMKFKKIFFILFLMLLIINCECVYAESFCKYSNDNRIVKIVFKDGQKYVYNNDNNVLAYFEHFQITAPIECPSKIYVVGFQDMHIYDSLEKVNAGIGALNHEELSLFNYNVSCGNGNGMIKGIPGKIPELTSFVFTLIQVAVPVILVIMGSIDLFKGITAQKEDEIKKGRQMFIKRLAVAAIIYFVVIIVKFLISIVADTNVSNMVDCIDCFVSNDCS